MRTPKTALLFNFGFETTLQTSSEGYYNEINVNILLCARLATVDNIITLLLTLNQKTSIFFIMIVSLNVFPLCIILVGHGREIPVFGQSHSRVQIDAIQTNG